MRRFAASILFALYGAAPGLAADTAAPTVPSDPWVDAAPLTVAPEEMLVAAGVHEAAEGDPIIVLFEEGRYVFDDEGRSAYTYRLVYRIRHESALPDWATVSAWWRPWYEDRPTVRARVIGPDGAVHPLDPSTLGEFGGGARGPEIYDDTRSLSGPLPAVRVGSIVELEIVTLDREPESAAGIVRTFYFGQPTTTARTRLTIEVPAAIPLRWIVRELPDLELSRTGSDGRVRVVFDHGPMAPIEEPEPHLPPEVPDRPYVAFSTGASWAGLAEAYGAIVDRAIEGADLSTSVREATAGRRGREEKIAALLALLHRRVRYTGVEFGSAALEPRRPAETLRRGYGDCKDKATLLVGMLRAAKIPARVALLRAGPGPDVDDGLPGISGFDHVIVHVPGPPERWIDATSEFTPLGRLPLEDQGRLALVAAPGREGLVRTPTSRAEDNRIVTTREVRLAEVGPGRVVESTATAGIFEDDYRSAYAATDPAEVKGHLEDYVADVFGATSLTSYEHTDPRDLARPFELLLEAGEVGIARTGRDDAAVAVDMGEIVEALVTVLADETGDQDAALLATEEGGEEREWTARRHDLALPAPFVLEWRYRIVPPRGFAPQPLPDPETIPIGPASLTTTAGSDAAGTVTALFRLDSGPQRWSPREVDGARSALRALRQRRPVLFAFDQIGEGHLAAGRIREAIEAFRSLAAAQPAKALPRNRLARALLAGGLGERAREEARRAVALEEASASAYTALGWVLEHDAIGRRFGKGWDRPGAIEAHRKATALDPDDVSAAVSLAIVLEHDAAGNRYGPGADLAGAIDEYKRIRRVGESPGIDDNLVIALGWAGRFEEVIATVDALEPDTVRSLWRVMAIAATRGVPAAVAAAATTAPSVDERRSLLQQASAGLVQMRRYVEAAGLLREGAKGAPDAVPLRSQADLLSRTRRYDDTTARLEGAAGFVRSFYVAALGGGAQAEAVRGMLAEPMRRELDTEQGLERLRSTMRTALGSARRRGVPLVVALDLLLGQAAFDVTGGEDVGWRVEVRPGGEVDVTGLKTWVAPEDGVLKIVGLAGAPATLGAEALRRLDRGDLRGARQWLDWAREELAPAGGDDPIAGPAFPKFWSRGSDAGEPQARLAAAVLFADHDQPAGSVPILEQARAASTDDAMSTWIDAALVRALLRLERFDAAETVARRLLAARPDSRASFWFLIATLAPRSRMEAMREAAAQRLERSPDDVDALRVIADALDRAGDYAGGEAVRRRLIAAGRAETVDYNNLAWYRLVRGAVDEEAEDWARRAVLASRQASPSALHTLAAVLAARGHEGEALEALRHEIEIANKEEPDGNDWFVIARLAESYGEIGAARDAYARVAEPAMDVESASSCWSLARRRLAALPPTP